MTGKIDLDGLRIVEVSSHEYDNDGVVVTDARGVEIQAFLQPEYASGVDEALVGRARDHVRALRADAAMERLAGMIAQVSGTGPDALARGAETLGSELRGKGQRGNAVADFLKAFAEAHAGIHRPVPYVALEPEADEEEERGSAPAP